LRFWKAASLKARSCSRAADSLMLKLAPEYVVRQLLELLAGAMKFMLQRA
jgi:hypothetical protein